MSEIVYQNEGTVASFPYKFVLEKTDRGLVGTVTAYVYKNVVIDDVKKLEDQMNQLYFSSDNSGFYMEGNYVVYRTVKSIDPSYKSNYSAEVSVRRHFIEDYLEDEHDLQKIIEPLGGETLKTEFVGQEF